MQRINLYAHLRQKESFPLSLDRIILIYGIFLFLLFINSFYEVWNKNKLSRQLSAETFVIEKTQSKINALLNKYPSLNQTDLKKSLQQLQEDMQAKANAINLLSQNAIFSNYMTALANTAVPNVWLSTITISVPDNQLHLQGYGTSASQIQLYLNQLNHQPVFKKIVFDLEEIKQSSLEDKLLFGFNIKTKNL